METIVYGKSKKPLLVRLYRKYKKKLLIRLFGYCYVHGHNFKMKKGWQSNPNFWQKLPGGGEIGVGCATKARIYYECSRCECHGEKVKNESNLK